MHHLHVYLQIAYKYSTWPVPGHALYQRLEGVDLRRTYLMPPG